jgi:polar amino acid transport system substrate-binding protein
LKPALSIVISAMLVVALVTLGAIIIRPTQAKVLVVGTNTPYPPFEYKELSGVGGFDMELIRTLALKAGYTSVVVKDIPYDRLLGALESGEIQVIASGFPINSQQAQGAQFTAPYWTVGQSVVMRAGSSSIASAKDLAGLKVGSIDLIAQRRLVKTEWYTIVGGSGSGSVKDNVSGGSVYRYTSLGVAMDDLIAGKLDAVVIDSPVAESLATRYAVTVALEMNEGTQYAFAVKAGNTALLDSLNSALAAFQGSPEWNALVLKYFGS